jgi:hypothetical protein
MREQSFTAAILLGASSFPLHSETYGPNEAFLHSKQDFRAYLQDQTHGLALPDEAICDLFDLQHLPSQQLVAMGRFLEKINKQVERGTLCNLIVYYVGHGYFAGLRQEYHVALACLEMGYDATTGLKVTELAEVLKERARSFRRFVILDCCFAAEALKEFQGGADDAVYAKAKGAFAEDMPRRPVEIPHRGTALYCAADKDSVARSPKELSHTMFTDALLTVLRSGDRQSAPYLTLADVKDLAWERLQSHSNPVRPVLHSPDQTEGDIAEIVGLFPNFALPGRTEAAPKQQAADDAHAGLATLPAGQLPGAEPGTEKEVGDDGHPIKQDAHSSPTSAQFGDLEEDLIAQLLRQLTRLVGPIAPTLVNRARKQAADLDTLVQLIAARLDVKERREFLAAAASLQATGATSFSSPHSS